MPRNSKKAGPFQKPRRSSECRALFAVLSEFVDGTLAAQDCRELRRHLRGCAPCLEYLETLRKTIRLCELCPATPAPAPSAVVRETLMKVVLSKGAGQNARKLRGRRTGSAS